MRIDLNAIDREQFLVHEHIIAGETCLLVQPQHVGCDWRPDNLHLRSSVWDSTGELVSASLPKFVNWEEKPDLYPLPTSLDNVNLLDKIDGSTLIVSKYRGQVILRTRGTVDAHKMDNGHEIDVLMARYPKILAGLADVETLAYSWIFEWTSPLNRIVLDYGSEPELRLIGCVDHADYSLMRQSILDLAAIQLGVKRPERYSFNTIPEMVTAIQNLGAHREGICVYYDGDQRIRKIKSLQYLAMHRFKERVTLPNMLDLFFAYGKPELLGFLARLESEFDFECMSEARPLVERICEVYCSVTAKIAEVKEHVGWRLVPVTSFDQIGQPIPRRDAALAIQAKWTDLYRGVAFKILDDRLIDDKMLRKLIEHQLDSCTISPTSSPASAP